MKFLFWVLGTLLALLVGLAPEIAMYFTYHLIAPQSDLARCLVLAIFWLGGAGLCVATAIIGLSIFLAATKIVLE